MIKFFLWFLFPDPKVGDKYVHESEVGDPWGEGRYTLTVTEVKGNWVRLRMGEYGETFISKTKQFLLAFYKKIN